MKGKQTLELTGIQRNFPAGMNDGGCDEFINTRKKNGALRPIGKKEYLYPLNDYTTSYIHKQDDFENWIGYDGNSLFHFNPSGPTVILDLGELGGELYDIRSLNNFLIATTSVGTKIWMWSDNQYSEINLKGIEARFDVELGRDTENTSDPDWTPYCYEPFPGGVEVDDSFDLAVQTFLANYYTKLNEHSAKSQFVGGVSYRVALRLFDGSYILHTVPRYYEFYDYDMLFDRDPAQPTATGGPRMRFGAAGALATAKFDTSDGFNYEGIKDIVSSIDIFFSKNEQFYGISEETITREFFQAIDLATPPEANAYDFLDVAPDFKELDDYPAWYKVGSIDIGELEGTGDVIEGDIDLDLKDYYQNYATRKTLPVDGYSHHVETGEASYVYNNRFMLGNTTQFLAAPDIMSKNNGRFGLSKFYLQPMVYDYDTLTYVQYQVKSTGGYPAKAIVRATTENGNKTTVADFNAMVYEDPSSANDMCILLEGISGYCDSRADSLEILISLDGGTTYLSIYTKNLSESNYSNYAYIDGTNFEVGELITPSYPATLPRRYDSNFSGITIGFTSLAPVTPVPESDSSVKNNNGRQVSDVSNPLVFDPLNFQDVSTGTIIAFGSNTDPISDSQFGQYPLYNFTSVGIWASQIGLEETYITNDVPVNGEVILNKYSKVDISFGTVYGTLEGLMIISGNKVIEISESIDGLPDPYFIENEQLQYFLNLPQTVNVQDIVDHVPFKTYLTDAKVGYSKAQDNQEIYVINSAYNYCYVFDIKNKMWSKVSGNFTQFINNYPLLYAYRETADEEGIVNMSSEIKSNVPMYFHTRALSLGGFEIFKKMRRSFLRCFLNMSSGKYAAFYLFSSDDLKTWKFITGNDRNAGAFNNIWMTHSNNSSRYYNYVFAAEVDFDPTVVDTHITHIEFQEEQKWSRKLR